MLICVIWLAFQPCQLSEPPTRKPGWNMSRMQGLQPKELDCVLSHLGAWIIMCWHLGYHTWVIRLRDMGYQTLRLGLSDLGDLGYQTQVLGCQTCTVRFSDLAIRLGDLGYLTTVFGLLYLGAWMIACFSRWKITGLFDAVLITYRPLSHTWNISEYSIK